jgi:hypothetical protein
MAARTTATTRKRRGDCSRSWMCGRRSAACLWLTCALLHVGAASADDAAAVVRADGLAALVGGSSAVAGVDVILRSDVELRARLSLAGQGAASSVSLSDALLAATLDELIGEALIAREAARVQIAPPSAADIKREKQRLVLMAGGVARSEEMLQALSATEDEIDAMAERRAIAAAFLSANLEGAMVVTDGEIEQRLRAEAASFEGIDPAQVRELLRARLARESLTRNIERWVRVLRARTKVRILAEYVGA